MRGLFKAATGSRRALLLRSSGAGAALALPASVSVLGAQRWRGWASASRPGGARGGGGGSEEAAREAAAELAATTQDSLRHAAAGDVGAVASDAVRMAQAGAWGAAESARLIFERATGLGGAFGFDGAWWRLVWAGGCRGQAQAGHTAAAGSPPCCLQLRKQCGPAPHCAGDPLHHTCNAAGSAAAAVDSAASASADAASRATDSLASGASAAYRQVRGGSWARGQPCGCLLGPSPSLLACPPAHACTLPPLLHPQTVGTMTRTSVPNGSVKGARVWRLPRPLGRTGGQPRRQRLQRRSQPPSRACRACPLLLRSRVNLFRARTAQLRGARHERL